MELNIQTAELALREAAESNPGAWAEHSRYVAEACKNIASHCKDLSSELSVYFRAVTRYWTLCRSEFGKASDRRLSLLYGARMGKSCTNMYIPRIYDTGYCHIYRRV